MADVDKMHNLIKANKTFQLTQKASFVLCITLRFIIAQNKDHFSVS
jgi:hypothetical protein